MKNRLLLLTFLFVSAFQSRATHLMGGDIMVYPSTTYTGKYELKAIHYRDTIGIPAAATIYLNIWAWDPATSAWGPYVLSTSIPKITSLSGYGLPGFPYGVEVNTYIDSNITLAPGKYMAQVTECCRNAAIMNMTQPLNEFMTLSSEFVVPVTGTNSSPQYLAMPIVYMPVNAPWTYNPVPYDPDGDSLTWALTTPVSNGSVNSPTPPTVAGYTLPPSATSGPFALNPATGQISWTPNTLGHFVASITVTEYKNGIPSGHTNRDMQYVVIPGAGQVPMFANVTQVAMNGTEDYYYIGYKPGLVLQFKLRGYDSTITDEMSMECYSRLFYTYNVVPSFNYTKTGNGNEIEATFKWTPTNNQSADEMVVFRLRNGRFSKDYTLMMRKNAVMPTAVNSLTALPSSLVMKAYPNPASNTLTVNLRSETSNNDLRLRLVDALGREAAQLYKGAAPKGSMQVSADLHCADGMYFLQALSGGQVIATQRVAVAH